MVKVGDFAPDFEAKDNSGRSVRLSHFLGKNLVLYFYPKDNSAGCTTEACGFRDSYEEFRKKRTEVLGVSLDGVESHDGFAKKYGLPFRLLSDPDGSISRKYGVYNEKVFMGKKIFGISRTTFLVDRDGRIKQVFKNIDVRDHSREILEMFG